jgi:molecular chaperone GrpE
MSQKKDSVEGQESEVAEDEVSTPVSSTDNPEDVLVGEILDAEPEVTEEEEVAAESPEAEDDEVYAEPSEEEEPAAAPSIEELYETALAKAEANRNDYLRSMADMQNLRKRTERDVKHARAFSIEGFARDLLPLADNMIRALAVLDGSDDPAIESLKEGVEMVQKELDRAFEKHGLVKIEALNAPFDPNLHQAVIQIEAPDTDPGIVVQEMQIGYMLNKRLLRPAMVGVSKSS